MNPYFGKDSSKAFKEACESQGTQETIDHLNELHHSDQKFTSKKSRKTKKNAW